jgi:hypothetical protein
LSGAYPPLPDNAYAASSAVLDCAVRWRAGSQSLLYHLVFVLTRLVVYDCGDAVGV